MCRSQMNEVSKCAHPRLRLKQVTNETEKRVTNETEKRVGDDGEKVADVPGSGFKYNNMSPADQNVVAVLMGSETDHSPENWKTVAWKHVQESSRFGGPCQGRELGLSTKCVDSTWALPTDVLNKTTGVRTPLPGTSFYNSEHGSYRLCLLCTEDCRSCEAKEKAENMGAFLAARGAPPLEIGYPAAARALADAEPDDPMELCDKDMTSCAYADHQVQAYDDEDL